MTQKYSLMIPTFNRPKLLDGLLSYLADQRASFPIFVLDSSRDENKEKNRAVVARYDLRAQIIDFDSDVRFDFKIAEALKKIDSEYVSLCADDDFVFTGTLEACIRELESDRQLVACHGIYLNFTDAAPEIVVNLEYASPSIDAEGAIERACQLLLQYEALNYAVYRHDVMASAIEIASEMPASMFWELLSGLAPILRGKVKRIGQVYYSRRSHGPSFAYPGRENFHPATWIASDVDGFLRTFSDFKRCLFALCEKKVPHFEAAARASLTQAILLYLCQTLGDGTAIRRALVGTPSPLRFSETDSRLRSIVPKSKPPCFLSAISSAITKGHRVSQRLLGVQNDAATFTTHGKGATVLKCSRTVRALLSSSVIEALCRFGQA